MIAIVLAVVLMVDAVVTVEGGGMVGEGRDSLSVAAITRAIPLEYAAYEGSLKGDYGLNDARAGLLLLAKVRGLLADSTQYDSNKADRIHAYRAVWELCLTTIRESGDPEAQALVVNEWDRFLREDDDAVGWQIYAAGKVWGREVLTGSFWQLLRETKNEKSVAAMCYVLYLHGEREDVVRLKAARRGRTSGAVRSYMLNAINWMNYRLRGDDGSPGPAHAPPRMEER